jgi:hypothetical protein
VRQIVNARRQKPEMPEYGGSGRNVTASEDTTWYPSRRRARGLHPRHNADAVERDGWRCHNHATKGPPTPHSTSRRTLKALFSGNKHSILTLPRHQQGNGYKAFWERRQG